MKLVTERKVNSVFWEEALEEKWTREEKLLYLYLLTNEDTPPPTYAIEVSTYEIRYEISLKIVAENIGCSIGAVKGMLDDFSNVHGIAHFELIDPKRDFGIITILG